MKRLSRNWLLAALLLLGGCATRSDVTHYAQEAPAFALEQVFSGTVDGWGMVQDRGGDVIKRFTVTIRCSWENGVGTLDEHFEYADGTRQQRIWTIRRTGDGRYTGTAGDIVGEATGRVAGNALHWNYTMAVPVDGRTVNLDFDDWMFRIDDEVVLNRTTMTKFGIRVGDITLSFRRHG
ncbi:MAG: DUF3833 domain-containing protein [Burkholderiaceae bacterium]